MIDDFASWLSSNKLMSIACVLSVFVLAIAPYAIR